MRSVSLKENYIDCQKTETSTWLYIYLNGDQCFVSKETLVKTQKEALTKLMQKKKNYKITEEISPF